MSAPRIGVTFRPQNPPELLLETARAAEHAGLDELWLWEDCFLESGIAAASAALAVTDGIDVGMGLLPVPLRNVALTAMELATLERLFPGRIIPVVGHGVQEWMGQVGTRVASPLTLMREYVVALRRLLAGDKVSVAGRYVTLDDVQLGWPPSTPPAVLVGATKEKTFALSGEVADGTVLVSGTSAGELRTAREQIGGARQTHQVVQYLSTAFGGGGAERMAAQAKFWGWRTDGERWAVGEPAEVAEAVHRWVEAGADTVVLEPTEPEPDLPGFVEQAGIVAELLRG
ncbi:MAG: LLM class flavin-dependent oxidoreductase [Propionibacteriaceae bacterium]